MEKIDHIGIAVKNLDETVKYYTEVLGLKLERIEEVPTQNVRVAFIDAGNVHIELLEPLSEEGAIYNHIQKRGEGIQHVCFSVDNIRETMAELKEKGVRLLSDEPIPAAGGAQACFIHPKNSFGVLYELYEKSGKGVNE
ncbi:methylmalonyl-CoA epimerase [Ureibacillus sp. FSL K6-8385]|uniref:Methylmalonyl-CoA epimerase n=1 Tax=Ureibacillus terrenus TaxID=118246 RepID=A0A540V654_9BACL|nr:methylmalonyl-CoA epimerase [Ureibacillus terrenus]MED3660792.1 methylmalonyl-CoA epimerase [Ureibacillus terrenus]MED3762980.1 methylmalonyl-CoA epimerase [Ureibacillus terrenus]TQE92221.1 methylmalonyl-CoA epimerase [Ureibacillus terrenus]